MEEQTAWQQTETEIVQPQKDKKNLAIAGFILGIVGLIAWKFTILGIAEGIVGIVMSIKGLKSSKRIFAIIGLVLSILGVIASIAYLIYAIVVVAPEVMSKMKLKS